MKFWRFGGKPEHLKKNLTEQRQKPTELNSHNDKCSYNYSNESSIKHKPRFQYYTNPSTLSSTGLLKMFMIKGNKGVPFQIQSATNFLASCKSDFCRYP